MTDDLPGLESKFLKSGRNRRTENTGLAVLLRDPRFQAIPRDLKRVVLDHLGVPDGPIQAFDAVMTLAQVSPLTGLTLPSELGTLLVVEMKTTQRAIQDINLDGFFFGVTESELTLADRLGDRYLFAFVVLNKQNVYGTEFFVLLTYEQLKARIRTKRTQFQVTLSRGLTYPSGPFGVGPGPLVELTSE